MFVSTVDRGWSVVERNSKIVTTLVALLFLGAIVYVSMDFLNRRADRKGSEDLYKVEAQYLKLKDGFEKAKTPEPPPAKDPTKDPKDKTETAKTEPPAQPASGDLQKDYGSVLPGLEQVADKHAGQSAGAQAAVIAADLYLEYKDPDKAVAVLDKVVTKQSSNDLMYGVAHLLRGSALAAKGDCNQAVSDWQKVVDSKNNKFLHPDALLKSGVCYETLKQSEKAMEMYKKVTQDHADTQAAQAAKTYLRAMETTANSAQPNAG